MLAVGTFHPRSGSAVPFRVFAKAEIEVELGNGFRVERWR